jgi:addiction module HigA family antidote
LSITIEDGMTRPAIHPGEILAEELAEIEVTPTELARQLQVPANRLTQIIQGKRAITGDTALRLGHWFGTSAQFWLNLQSAYDSAWRNGTREPTSPRCRRGARLPARAAPNKHCSERGAKRRHCEERSDEAIQISRRILDCFAFGSQ